MSDSYRITVHPHLLREGPDKGHMEYVEFIATSGGYTICWHETNYGQLAESFRRVVPAGIADNLISILRMRRLPFRATTPSSRAEASARRGKDD